MCSIKLNQVKYKEYRIILAEVKLQLTRENDENITTMFKKETQLRVIFSEKWISFVDFNLKRKQSIILYFCRAIAGSVRIPVVEFLIYVTFWF